VTYTVSLLSILIFLPASVTDKSVASTTYHQAWAGTDISASMGWDLSTIYHQARDKAPV